MKVAHGAPLELSATVIAKIRESHARAQTFVDSPDARVYGLTTGVGALADTIIPAKKRRDASRQIVKSHAAAYGDTLGKVETRAIMAAAINNYCLGYSGIRLEMVQQLVGMLNHDVIPAVRDSGSIGYLSHMAQVGLGAIGDGPLFMKGVKMTGAEALQKVGMKPLVLEAGEGLSMVQGTPCVTGLACVALEKLENTFQWSLAVSSMTFELLGGQLRSLDSRSLNLRKGGHLDVVGAEMTQWLHKSDMIAPSQGKKTQDALSLRTIPALLGVTLEFLGHLKNALGDELKSATDNPAINGTVDNPEVWSHSHAVATRLSMHLDSCAIPLASMANQSDARIKRLLMSSETKLRAFLGDEDGKSGLMLIDYVMRRMVEGIKTCAIPASIAGGMTSGIQEDFLVYATPSAEKLLKSAELLERAMALELLVVCQAYRLKEKIPDAPKPSPNIAKLVDAMKQAGMKLYDDEEALYEAIDKAVEVVQSMKPKDVL